MRNFPMIVNWRTICLGLFQLMPPIPHILNWYPPKKQLLLQDALVWASMTYCLNPHLKEEADHRAPRLDGGGTKHAQCILFPVVRLKLLHCTCMHSIKNACAVRRGPVSKAGFNGRWLAIVCWDFKRPQKHGVLFQLIWKHGCCECHLCFVVYNGVPEILTEGWS